MIQSCDKKRRSNITTRHLSSYQAAFTMKLLTRGSTWEWGWLPFAGHHTRSAIPGRWAAMETSSHKKNGQLRPVYPLLLPNTLCITRRKSRFVWGQELTQDENSVPTISPTSQPRIAICCFSARICVTQGKVAQDGSPFCFRRFTNASGSDLTIEHLIRLRKTLNGKMGPRKEQIVWNLVSFFSKCGHFERVVAF